LEFRIVLIKWLLYTACVMLVTFLLLIMDIRLRDRPFNKSDKNLVRRNFWYSYWVNIMANIVFITNVNECPFEIIEFVMLFTKYYIHCCKW
jgi:hypothetical protein